MEQATLHCALNINSSVVCVCAGGRGSSKKGCHKKDRRVKNAITKKGLGTTDLLEYFYVSVCTDTALLLSEKKTFRLRNFKN